MKAGLGAIHWSGLGITTAAIVFSPLLGFALALLLVLTVSWVFVRSTPSRSTTYSASAPSKGGMALSSFAIIAARARS
jgi:phosphate/sulfate permease